MIIREIEVHNLGPHEHVQVQFSAGGNVIIGPSDYGKSYLIMDSILYALYGRHRGDNGDTQRPDKLIHEDRRTRERAEVMSARVVVTPRAGSADYEIVRSRRYNRTTTLSAVNLSTGLPIAADGAGVNDTQAAIDTLLGLDHRQFRFVCSIEQKSALKWSQASDSDRERIVKELMNVDRFATWSKAAASLIWQREKDVKDLTARRDEQLAAAADADAAKSVIASIAERLSAAQNRVKNQSAALALTMTEVAAAKAAALEIDAKRKRSRDLTSAREDQQYLRRQVSLQLETARSKSAKISDLRTAAERLSALWLELASLRGKSDESERVAAEIATLKAKIDKTGHAIRELIDAASASDRKLSGLDIELRSLPVPDVAADERRIAELERAVAPLNTMRARRDELTAEIERAAATVADFEKDQQRWVTGRDADIANLERQEAELQKRAALMQQVPCSGTDINADCRLLAEAHSAVGKRADCLKRLEDLLASSWGRDAELSTARQRLESLRSERSDLQQRGLELATKERELQDARQQLRIAERQQARRTEITADIERLRHHISESGARHAELVADQSRMGEELRSATERAEELSGSVEKIRMIGFEIDTLDGSEADLQAAIAAEARIPDLDAAFAAHGDRIAEIDRDLDRIHREIESARTGDKLAHLEAEAARIRAEIAAIEAEIEQIRQEETGARVRQQLAQKAATKAAEITGEIIETDKQLGAQKAYKAVCDQAPKIIIENRILPAYRNAAARIYREIMGGNLVVATQREQKTTTELKEAFSAVVDGLDLDMLGGTASMAAELAQIIALQDALLGSQHGFLILDEMNLGWMDPPHLARTKEVLSRLERMVPQILFVTHIEEMKDTYQSVIDFGAGNSEEVAA